MIQKKWRVLLATMIACLGIYTYVAKSIKDPQEVIVVGMMSGYVPFLIVNDSGNFEGYEFELAHAIAQKLNKKLVIKDMRFSALLKALDHGDIDIMIADIGITKEREHTISFIHYRGKPEYESCLVFWKHNPIPLPITTLEDLRPLGKITICVEGGTIMEKLLKKYDFISPCVVDCYADALIALKNGKAIATIIMEEVLTHYEKQIPDIVATKINLEEFTTYGAGIGIKKDNTVLINQVYKAIDSLKNDGSLSTLAHTWNVPL